MGTADDLSVMAADGPRRIYPDGESFLAALDDLGPEGDCTPEEAVEAVKASRKAASELLDAYVLAAFLEVSPATIRSWAHRGHISRRGTSR